MKRWAFALIAGFVALRSVLFLERWGRPAGAAWVVFDIGLYGVLWAVCVTSVLWLAGRRGGGDDRGLRLACLCGVGAFLLQNMIDFSLFYPGSLTPFAAVAGVMLAAHAGENARPARAVVRGLPLALVLIGLAACLASLLPVIRASSELARARRDSSHAPAHYLAAAARDPLDPTPWDELAGWRAAPGPGSDLDAALEAMHQAITRDPANLDLYRKQSRLLEARYRKHDSAADLLAAIGAAEKVVELYPASPEGHAALADLLAVGAEAFDDPDAARQARGHYLTALDLDAARPAHEIRRWPEACRRQVQTRMNALPSSPGSAPANERGRS